VIYLAALLLGIVQGLTEFLPVSSSAHLILARLFFGWDAGQLGLPFDVACHVGTLAAVVVFFRTDLVELAKAAPGLARPDAACASSSWVPSRLSSPASCSPDRSKTPCGRRG
jgi:undecaprenyl pyrophosphate phosphatase UppP